MIYEAREKLELFYCCVNLFHSASFKFYSYLLEHAPTQLLWVCKARQKHKIESKTFSLKNIKSVFTFHQALFLSIWDFFCTLLTIKICHNNFYFSCSESWEHYPDPDSKCDLRLRSPLLWPDFSTNKLQVKWSKQPKKLSLSGGSTELKCSGEF